MQYSKAEQIWNRLLTTMECQEANDRHMTATCNAISVFLQSSCNSHDKEIVELGLSSNTWNSCVEAVSNVFETGKVKATRQVLATLTGLLQTLPAHAQLDILKAEMVAKALDVIYTSKPRQQLKASMNFLELLLRRVVGFDDILKAVQQCRQRNSQEWSRRLALDGLPIGGVLCLVNQEDQAYHNGCDPTEILFFVFTLWHDFVFTDLHPSVVSLFLGFAKLVQGSPLHTSLFSTSADQRAPWTVLLLHLLSICPGTLDMFASHLFPRLGKLDPAGYRQFAVGSAAFPGQTESTEVAQLSAKLAAMQIGRQHGLLSSKDLDAYAIGNNIPVAQLLCHANREIRYRAFALLVNSSVITEPISAEILDAILANLAFLYGDSEANNRSDILSVTRRLIIRIRASSRRRHTGAEQIQQKCKTFMSSFVGFLEGELGPTCSYQRHISALKAIEMLIDSGLDSTLPPISATKLGNDQIEFDFAISLHSVAILSSILDLTMNAFQDVRASAASLLSGYSTHLTFTSHATSEVHVRGSGLDSSVFNEGIEPSYQVLNISTILRRAEKLAMRTHRADHADGLGRLYALQFAVAKRYSGQEEVLHSLISRVERRLIGEDVDVDFRAPLQGIPLHGILVGLR